MTFAALYAVALLVMVVGIFGLFGADRDPLSAIFLVPLGLPWNRMIDGLPESALPWAAALAPMLNLLLLAALCRNRRPS